MWGRGGSHAQGSAPRPSPLDLQARICLRLGREWRRATPEPHGPSTLTAHAHGRRVPENRTQGPLPRPRLTACSSSRLSLESSALRVDSAPWTPRPSVTLVSFSPSVGAHGYDQGPGSLPGHWPCCWGQARPSHMAGPGQEGQRLPPRPLLPQLPRATRHPALQRGRCWVLLPCPTAAAWSPLPSSPSPWRV